ncbi:hypothetical protein F2P81_018811 [Scophthalmus maximus]|uniref:Uncharacterized protein n=1 Tax=Scophthalmus maximus TaxID=52904 RepID=A0A6A4S3B7_SCOMX|nr:hypothetical protein F2P81_018811 [Scophthalmus maximus]
MSLPPVQVYTVEKGPTVINEKTLNDRSDTAAVRSTTASTASLSGAPGGEGCERDVPTDRHLPRRGREAKFARWCRGGSAASLRLVSVLSVSGVREGSSLAHTALCLPIRPLRPLRSAPARRRFAPVRLVRCN